MIEQQIDSLTKTELAKITLDRTLKFSAIVLLGLVLKGVYKGLDQNGLLDIPKPKIIKPKPSTWKRKAPRIPTTIPFPFPKRAA